MMNRFVAVLTVLVFVVNFCYAQSEETLSSSPPSSGTPYVRFDMWNAFGGVCNGLYTRTLYNTSGATSSISLGTCEQYVIVSTTRNGGSFDPDIGRINLSGGVGNGFGPIQVNFVVNAPNTALAPPPIPTGANGDVSPSPIGANFAGIDTSSTNTAAAFYGGVRGNLTQPINVGQLAFFRADGAINSNISAATGFNSSQRVYVQATNAITGSVTLTSGVLARVRAFSGNISGGISAPTILVVESAQADITGNISATTSIGTVSAPLGAIGTTTSTISGPVINIIDATGPLSGSFSATGSASDAGSALQRFRGTTFAGSLNVSRVQKLASGQAWTNAIDLSGASTGTITVRDSSISPIAFSGGAAGGSISLGSLSGTASVTGALGAPLTVANTSNTAAITVGSVPAGKTITVTGSHAGSLTIGGAMGGIISISGSLTSSGTVAVVPSGGLAGQIILNAGNATTNAWAGTVSVDGYALSPSATGIDTAPYYTRHAADLGGGSIGVATFVFHDSDCFPSVSNSSANSLSVANSPSASKPILLSYYGPLSYSSTPVIIKRRRCGTSTWSPDVVSCFGIDLTNANHNTLRITPLNHALQSG